MARFKDQERRRDEIVAATLQVLRESGSAALRLRDVAARAGVSTGTVHYYFDDVQGLLAEVHARARKRFYDDRLSRLTQLPDARDKLVAAIRGGLPTSTDDDLVAALYHLDGQMRFREPNSELYTALYDTQVAIYVGILEVGVAQGHFELAADPTDLAQNLVALEDAYGEHIVVGVRSLHYERVVELLCGYARLATRCADIVPDREVPHAP
ncbi:MULTISPECIES: TetR/AcrR family transcriptional regulator [Pimelobacter]|uniref:TetR/AcrR family transcriptional regulator n=1 Tax=Pimelobacter TaxID=2044 RepID=UPI001C05B729|nr:MULTISPECIES: TetR family transcriptional regulator [Pimelobacter]MBU2697915.1 TetR family transcriptional regulator [Pimelobacter sp. 30-1]UUW92431.1 TetR family transcriptional regulator [Pimelobacter simplex]UUW96259.1 TetR family transcriptional regulator [Pimelobacter simplex]